LLDYDDLPEPTVFVRVLDAVYEVPVSKQNAPLRRLLALDLVSEVMEQADYDVKRLL
jgi:hypothetical protein